MAELSDYTTAKDLQSINNLQVLARQVVEGFCSGLHRSPNKGHSVEFRQHRQYVAGDEIRHLDWKVFGKSDRFYIREYEEETNLRATILLDGSGSMEYGSDGITKHHYASRLAACLAYLMLKQADGVGLVTFDTKVRDYVPTRSRPGHLRILLDTLDKAKPRGETALNSVFREMISKLNRRGLLIVISDCFDDPTELLKALAHFRHAHHDLIVFQIWDRAELEFPFNSWTRFESIEDDGHHLVDPSRIRDRYFEKLEEFRENLTRGCRRHRIDLVPMVTDEPYAEGLAKYLKWRASR